MKFVILGAGLSGLSCGVALARNGHDVVVLEREDEVGGLARTFRTDGYAFDYGPHYLFGPKVLPLLKDVLAPNLELMSVKRTKERMYFREKFFKFPFEPKNLLFNMDPAEAVFTIVDLLAKRFFGGMVRNNRDDVEHWVIQSVGKRIYEYTSLGGYIEKLYGMSPKDISKSWGIQKLKFLSRLQNAGLVDLVRRALGEKKQLAGQVVSYPRSGIDGLAVHLGQTFTQDGGKFCLSSSALAVKDKGDRISVEYQKGGERLCMEGDFLVSTIPLGTLFKLMKPSPPVEIGELSDSLRYRATLLLFLRLKKEKVMDHQCVYFTDATFPFRRITEFKNLDATMSPKDKTSLCVEMTCFEEEDIFSFTPEKIFEQVIGPLEKGGYLNTSDVEGYHLLRVPKAYPVYDLNHGVVLDRLLDYLGDFSKMISVGRQGLFFYNNMSNSIIDGYQLGSQLSKRTGTGLKNLISEVYHQRKEEFLIDS